MCILGEAAESKDLKRHGWLGALGAGEKIRYEIQFQLNQITARVEQLLLSKFAFQRLNL